MIGKIFDFNIRTKILIIFVVIFGLASLWILRTTIYQVEAENQQIVRELLQVNAHMTIAIVDTVRMYTEMTLELAAERVMIAMITGRHFGGELRSLVNNINVEYEGVYLIENLKVFDNNFNMMAAATTRSDTLSLSEFIEPGDDLSASRIFPTFIDPELGNVQVVFTHPVMHQGEVIATVMLTANTEVLHFFVKNFLQIYDSFVNVADVYGIIFFSTRPEAYLGIHINELGLYEAFGEIPKNTVFRHTSAVTRVDKLAYIVEYGELNWMVVSFFDADRMEYNFYSILASVMPVMFSIILTGAVTFILITHSLRPLKKLAEGANEVSKGNVSVSFRTEQNDEIGQVSRSFMGVITALNVLSDNFKNAETALMEGRQTYSLTDTKLGGIYDKMIASTNNIIRHIQLSMEEAQQASKAKSDFLATMSHEIRTPLNAILGITHIELQKLVEEDSTAKAFHRIHQSGRTLLSIINDILDMSKIETGKFELTLSEYDVANLINETVQANIVRIGSKDIEFVLSVDKNLPRRLIGDELRIKQIMNNILSNAIKYTAKGYVKFTITGATSFAYSMRSIESLATLKFVVEDSGQGMKPEDLQIIFEPYIRFNMEENRVVEGSGLGLTITKKLIEMMDGWITVESECGKGSVFTVCLLQKTATIEIIGKDAADKLGSLVFLYTGEKNLINYEPMPYGSVLVVDDVETNLFVAEGLLAPYQVNVELVTSGFDVLDKVEKGAKYDIIFMDHMMPIMDGIETTNKLRQQGYDGTIIALTANALIGNDEMFRSKGFDWYISKPVDVRQLDAALLRFIRNKYPEKHAIGESKMLTQPTRPENIQPKLRNAVLRDTTRAVKAIKDSLEDGDVEAYIISVHSMKSAMANIKEMELAETAKMLEKAGHDEDYDFIYEQTPKFVKRLEELVERL